MVVICACVRACVVYEGGGGGDSAEADEDVCDDEEVEHQLERILRIRAERDL